MTVRQIQGFIATVFFVLGGWCLVSPGTVLALSVRPAFQSEAPIAAIAIGCFGAQAMIAGIFAAFATFTRRTFLAYGVAVLPFFGFDYYFYAVKPVFTEVILLDAVGNIIFLVLCGLGYRKAAV